MLPLPALAGRAFRAPTDLASTGLRGSLESRSRGLLLFRRHRGGAFQSASLIDGPSGLPTVPRLTFTRASPADDEPVDAEIVEPLSGPWPNQYDLGEPVTPETDPWQPAEPLAVETDPLSEGLMPLDEAVIRAAQFNREAIAGHAMVHRPQRALPPGRSG